MFLAVNPISADLVPSIFDAALGLAVLRVTGLEASVDRATGVESGVVKAVVTRVLRPDQPPAGSPASFPFARLADEELRFRNGANAWNTLRLEKDACLAVAWAAADAARGVFSVAAACSYPNDNDPDLAELRRAVETHARTPDARVKALGTALVEGKNTLRRYACAAVAQRGLVPRDQGVAMLVQAIADPKTDAEHDLILADALIAHPLYDATKGPDGPNAGVLTALARNMLAAKPGDAAAWMRLLYGSVMIELADDPDENLAKRRDLIRAIGVPPKKLDERLRELSRTAGLDIPLAVNLQAACAAAWKD
ncbi:MAG: hypothetical protein HBSAPP03_07780 [Phycisphaerae bacterium]|nr:MAG: hypothetical protein HBSAPP03_07780 [Phycisphaerae bacterium]